MNLKRALIPVLMMMSLAPMAAFAEHDNLWEGQANEWREGSNGRVRYHRHGRYELRMVQKWVPGHYVQQWVPGGCVQKRWRTKCWEGRYEQRWLEGRYENVEEWVWVPRHNRYPAPPIPPHWNRPPSGQPYPHQPASFQVRVNL